MSFDAACSLVEAVLRSDARREAVASAAHAATLRIALEQLEAALAANVWPSGGRRIELAAVIDEFDIRTRRDGFHALHDWDGVAARVNAETIPVDVLRYLIDERGGDPPDATALAVLIDYHFLYVLGLLSLRVWDEGDPSRNFDRVTGLLRDLQSPGGSGQRFVADAETLLLLATSHYEPAEHGYHETLKRARGLDDRHQVALAMAHAASMGSHLRFGVEATYGRDMGAMRADNTADYPWLCFALVVLMREYVRLLVGGAAESERERVVEALVCGLSPDAVAFVGPASLTHAASTADRAELRELFHAHRQALIEDCERHRPSERGYSPVSLFFNFAFNVVKGSVVDALLWGEPRAVSLNDLLTGLPREDAAGAAKLKLARTLMTYARAHPDTIRGRRTPVIVYDPSAGRMAFGAMMRTLKG